MKEQDYIAILKKMTLEEKAALCSGQSFWTTVPIENTAFLPYV